jgi:DNA mismatch repair protein MutL
MAERAGGGPEVRRLDDALIDQIAAGEVVERPASIVKELVENALDAGAHRIRVEVRGGGVDWIAVTDDGHGMSPADAERALERHATSKLATVDDLQRIGSYGFRGEALPAIASVSNLRLRTRARGTDTAFELRIRGGKREFARETGGPEGTRIEVSDLFESVPARRKFLKSAITEWGHVADWLVRAALALPQVHFDVHRDDKPALAWPAVDDLADRVSAVLGEQEASVLVPAAHSEGRLHVEGLVSRPDQHKGTTAGIRIFVNRRPVRDRMLQHALIDVYRDVLPRGRFPSAVLFLEVPPEAVDVNVHPAKWEVRFAEPRGIHRLIREAVRGAVAARPWVAGAPVDARARTASEPDRSFRRGEPSSRAVGSPAPATTDWIFARGQTRDTALGATEAPLQTAVETRVRFGDLRRLGQLLTTYLVLEGKDQLLLVDQHAAHERVLYERLRAEWLDRGVERQGLLAPLAVELEPRAYAALLEDRSQAQKLGFELESFGEDTVALRSVPALLARHDPAALLRSLADELAAGEGALSDASAIRALPAADRLFATLACHSARRKGDVLDPVEQQALLDALDAIPWAPTCPHGRPVCVPLAQAEIERRFGRR